MLRAAMVAAGLLCLLSAWLKIRSVRRQPRAAAPRAMVAGLLLFGASFLVVAPPHPLLISDLLHVPNSGRLLGNLLTLASAGSIQVVMLHLLHPPAVAARRVRRRLLVLTLVALAMTVLLVSAHTETVPSFIESYATYTPVYVYQLLYLTCLAFAIADLIHLAVRYSQHVPPMLRAGLRLVAAGGVIFAVHTAYKMVRIVAARTGHGLTGDQSAVSAVLAIAGGILVAAGTTLPIWGPWALAPVRLLRQYRSYRRLAPLWRELTSALPGITLPQAEAEHPWTMDIRLYRRVIEIRDAQMSLRPYSEPAAVAAAQEAAHRRGLTGDKLQAEVDAVALVTGLRRWRTDGPGTVLGVPVRLDAGDASLAHEIRYLERVAAAFVPAQRC